MGVALCVILEIWQAVPVSRFRVFLPWKRVHQIPLEKTNADPGFYCSCQSSMVEVYATAFVRIQQLPLETTFADQL